MRKRLSLSGQGKIYRQKLRLLPFSLQLKLTSYVNHDRHTVTGGSASLVNRSGKTEPTKVLNMPVFRELREQNSLQTAVSYIAFGLEHPVYAIEANIVAALGDGSIV